MNNNILIQVFDALMAAFSIVIIDVEADFESRDDCGSFDIEERNGIGRQAISRATAVFVTSQDSMKGSFSQAAIIQRLVENKVAPESIVSVSIQTSKFALPLISKARNTTKDFPLHSTITIPFLRTMEQVQRDVSRFPEKLLVELKQVALELLKRPAKDEEVHELEAI